MKFTQLLYKELNKRYDGIVDFRPGFNVSDRKNKVIVAYVGSNPVGCGALVERDKQTVEIKMMYVHSQSRGMGIASIILFNLEYWAKELLYRRSILQTGIRQPEAIKLYMKYGYELIQNYGHYSEVHDCRSFQKILSTEKIVL